MSCDFNENQITEIAESLRNVVVFVTNSSDLNDMGKTIGVAITNLDNINNNINDEAARLKDCMKRFKTTTPEIKYDDLNTSHMMLENSQSYHTDIIYSRIQIIIYIIGLLYFYKTVLSG